MFNYTDALYSQLKGFYFTAIFKSVSLAANSLGLTQPAVSQQIKLLQKTLGKKFFFRKNNKMQLTHDGKILFKDVKKLIEKMDEIYTTQTQIKNEPRIHIVGIQGALNYVIPKSLKKYRDKFPDIKIQLEYTDTHKDKLSGYKALDNGADLFFTTGEVPIPDDYKFTTLKKYPVKLMAHPDHPITKLKNIQLKDVFEHELILLLGKHQAKEKFEIAYKHYSSALTIERSDLLNLQKCYVKEGIAITIGATVILDDNDKELFTYPMDQFFKDVPYGVVTHENQEQPEHVKAFIDMLKEDLS